MIKRLYADNYQCFVNFECRFDSLHLLMGQNGSGKTTVFNLLEALRNVIVDGEPTIRAFPFHTFTAWELGDKQHFELDLLGNGGVYGYRLELKFDRKRSTNFIQYEELRFGDKLLYLVDNEEIRIYRDDSEDCVSFPFEASRSALSSIPEHLENNKLLLWFRRRMERVHVFSPDPLRMAAESHAERERPDRRLHELVSWIRHLSLEAPDVFARISDALKQGVLEDLSQTSLRKAGANTRLLTFDFRAGNEPQGRKYSLEFDQLSDGQRNLVALFTILYGAIEADSTVCIDEPDNYIALREIQPWLKELTDRVEDCGGQCFLISHHPELINDLAELNGLNFCRDDLGAARAKPFQYSSEIGILPAEVVARGWENP